MEHSTSITSIARHSSPAERLSFGKALRDTVPRSTHGNWNQSADRPDPIAALEASSQGRLPKKSADSVWSDAEVTVHLPSGCGDRHGGRPCHNPYHRD